MPPASPAVLAAAEATARKLPGVTLGIACRGTALESHTLKLGSKAFAFFRPGTLMLKLATSLPAARTLAASDPRVRAGASGWVTIDHADGLPVSATTLHRWLRESHALFAAKPSPRRRSKTAPGRNAKRGPG